MAKIVRPIIPRDLIIRVKTYQREHRKTSFTSAVISLLQRGLSADDEKAS